MHNAVMAANLPHRHHYIPCFYTSQWVDEDGKLCVFRKNSYKGVVHRRLAPAATGYQDRLYELRHALPKEAQKIEEEFFRPVDTAASEAQAAFVGGVDPRTITPRHREAWARFLLSLTFRCPEDIEFLKNNWHAYIAKISPENEAAYALDRDPGDTRTLADLVKAANPAYIEDTSMYALRFIITAEKSIPNLLTSDWVVFDTSRSRFSLLTSDRPIVRLQSLGLNKLLLALPLAPTLMFAMFSQRRQWRSLSRGDADMIVMESNRKVVEGAAKYVFGLDTSQKPFITANFGSKPAIRLIQHGMSRRLADINPIALSEDMP